MIPPVLMTLLTPFQSLFRRPTWIKVQILLVGAILSAGKRTVTQALRVTGRSTDRRFALYHHVLSRAVRGANLLGKETLSRSTATFVSQPGVYVLL